MHSVVVLTNNGIKWDHSVHESRFEDYTQTPPFCHQILGNGYALLKIMSRVLSLIYVNVTIEGSYNMQRLLIFATHLANFQCFDATNFLTTLFILFSVASQIVLLPKAWNTK
jgi:hypothetical protein